MGLDNCIESIKGVGDKVGEKLRKLGIETIADMLMHYPKEYEDRRKINLLEECELEVSQNILVTVCSKPQVMKKGSKILVSFRVKDSTSSIMVTYFGQPYLKNQFELGGKYILYGKIKHKYGQLEMDSPEYQRVRNEDELRTVAKITPIYPSTKGLSQKVIRTLIQKSIEEAVEDVKETLPEYIIEQYSLMSKKDAIRNIHFPAQPEMFIAARKRLVFEELFLLQLSLYQLKADFATKLIGMSHKITPQLKEFMETLPFELTNAQKRVMREITSDLKSNYAMNRLVQGDVGSGKTVIAAISLFMAVKDGFQGVLMAPTEVLALQHYEFLRDIMEPFGVRVAALTGSTTAKQKRELLDGLYREEIKVVVGTHALIEDNVIIPKLGLVITDEQHRFGVRQRLKLSQKGMIPDVMVMTATPIPRTLALILYGDMDISIIDELPPGRYPIKTNAVDSAYHPRIYRFIMKQIQENRQCYIICPMVEENEKLSELKNVVDYTDELSRELVGVPIEYLHGKMKSREKNEIMSKFARGETKVLISTTVIEVGVNVPNASLIVIENAERFGLAQLHQLRGRVGRGKHQSFCILVSDSKNKVTKKRLKIMEESTDGFVIAETDLKLRGPGEFFGTKQHGLPEMKIANLYTDAKVLSEVQKCVKKMLSLDPNLEKIEHVEILDDIKMRLNKQSLHNAL